MCLISEECEHVYTSQCFSSSTILDKARQIHILIENLITDPKE